MSKAERERKENFELSKSLTKEDNEILTKYSLLFVSISFNRKRPRRNY